VTAFWQQLPHAVLQHSALRLAAGTHFLGEPKLGGALYVRNDYVGMLAELLPLISLGNDKVVLSGNPGIGKSWFGFFLLHHIATTQPGVRVVWESSLKQTRLLFTVGTVWEGGMSSFRSVMHDPAAWCALCGPLPPRTCDYNTVPAADHAAHLWAGTWSTT
jgi:hypothetical protein